MTHELARRPGTVHRIVKERYREADDTYAMLAAGGRLDRKPRNHRASRTSRRPQISNNATPKDIENRTQFQIERGLELMKAGQLTPPYKEFLIKHEVI